MQHVADKLLSEPFPEKEYQYSKNWFDHVLPLFRNLFRQYQPSRILEIGSFEGASACFAVQSLGSDRALELHCIDTWLGGVEHQPGQEFAANMSDVERRFRHNVSLACSRAAQPVDLHVHKGLSSFELPKLLTAGYAEYFDLIYVDGSHQAPDVLTDAVLAFQLLKVRGVLVFDDYLWSEQLGTGKDPLRCPKIAIDAFTTIFCRKLEQLNAPAVQVYLRKVAS